jgi:hypothetical protein
MSTDAVCNVRSTSIRDVRLLGTNVARRVELTRSKLHSGTVAPGPNLRIWSTPAYPRFPPVHRVDLEGQQRVEPFRSVEGAHGFLAKQNLARTWLHVPGWVVTRAKPYDHARLRISATCLAPHVRPRAVGTPHVPGWVVTRAKPYDHARLRISAICLAAHFPPRAVGTPHVPGWRRDPCVAL